MDYNHKRLSENDLKARNSFKRKLKERKEGVDRASMLLEKAAFKTFKAKRALKENDMELANQALEDAGAAVNAVDASMETYANNDSIAQKINSIKSEIESLAIELGVEPPIDLDADVNAGIGAVTGAVTDPIQTDVNLQNAQMLENKLREKIRKKLKEERDYSELHKNYSSNNQKQGRFEGSRFGKITKEDKTFLSQPKEKELSNGSKGSGNRWKSGVVYKKFDPVTQKLSEKGRPEKPNYKGGERSNKFNNDKIVGKLGKQTSFSRKKPETESIEEKAWNDYKNRLEEKQAIRKILGRN